MDTNTNETKEGAENEYWIFTVEAKMETFNQIERT